MTDGLERDLRDLDIDRPLPPSLHARLEAALLEDATAGRAGDAAPADAADAALFDALDAPRPIPPATLAAIERELTGRTDRAPLADRRSRVLLAVAAAVLLVVGSVAALRTGRSDTSRDIAVGPTVPDAGAPPLLRLPTTAAEPLPVIVGRPAAPPTTRRPTTTTTWDCGLCARNGYAVAAASAGAAGPAGPATGAGGSPGGSSETSVVAAAALGSVEGWSVDPSSGPRRGGTIVTITGYGFTGASGVFFGTTSAANWTVVSDRELRVMTPPSARRQTVPVTVAYPDGTTSAASGNSPPFTYT